MTQKTREICSCLLGDLRDGFDVHLAASLCPKARAGARNAAVFSGYIEDFRQIVRLTAGLEQRSQTLEKLGEKRLIFSWYLAASVGVRHVAGVPNTANFT